MPSNDIPLASLAGRLISGEVSQREALEQVASWEPLLMDEEARLKLLATIVASTQTLLPGQRNMSALDLGHLLRAAARLLHPELEAFVALRAGSHFLHLDGAELALPWLDFARNQIGPEYDALAWHQWLLAHHSLGHDEAVEQHLEGAFERCRERNDSRTEVALLELQARHLAKHHQALAAIEALDEAIVLRRQLPEAKPYELPVSSELELWGRRGTIARDSGQLEKAVRSFEQARELAKETRSDWNEVFMTSEIGVTWQLAGAKDRAAKILEDAARRADRLGDTRAALRWGGRIQGSLDLSSLKSSDLLANAQRMLKAEVLDHEAIDDLLARCLDAAREEGLPQVEAMAYNLRGIHYSSQNFVHRAWAAYEEALFLAEESGARHLMAGIRLNLCLALINGRSLGPAQEHLEQTIEQGEQLRAEAPSTELRKVLSGQLLVAYELLLTLIALGWSTSRGELSQAPEPDRALQLSQRAQAVNLSGWLALGNLARRQSDLKIRSLISEFQRSEVLLERTATAGGQLSSKIQAAQRSRAALEEAFRAAKIPTSALQTPIVDLDILEELLSHDEVLIDLFSADNRIIFTIVAGNGTVKCGEVPWKRNDRLDFLDRWALALDHAKASMTGARTGRWRYDSDPMRGRARGALGGPESPFEALIDELGTRLVEPIIQELAPQDLTHCWISPHLELFTLPFWPLAQELGADFSILPNATALALLSERPARHEGPSFKIGDATNSLPFVSQELATLETYIAVPAQIDLVLEKLQNANAVHFACHGLFDGTNPYDSGLILGKSLPGHLSPEVFVADLGNNFGGFRRLTVAGVLNHLRFEACDLVVLSACCTGLPELDRAGEITGLPSAFLVAGARTVIASLWPTHDAATALLMQEFYSQLKVSRSPASAIRAASTAVGLIGRDEALERLGEETALPPGERPFASPLFTMPFQCYGMG